MFVVEKVTVLSSKKSVNKKRLVHTLHKAKLLIDLMINLPSE